MRDALDAARAQGGSVIAGGGRRLAGAAPGAFYAEPTLVRMPAQTAIVREETFAPILYLLPYQSPRASSSASSPAFSHDRGSFPVPRYRK